MRAAVAFDPFNPDVLCDPYGLYADMRSSAPVSWDDHLQAWLLTRHRDCVAVLRDTKCFGADPRRAGELVPSAAITVQLLDPPDHAAVRAALINACRAQDMAAIRRQAREHADALFALLAKNGGGEFMTAFAAPFSLASICHFLGIDSLKPETMAPIGDAMMKGMDAGLRPEQAEPAAEAREKLSAIFESWFQLPPKAGMIGTLFAQNAGKAMDPAIINSVYVIFNSGYLSTSGAIGNAVLALLLRHDGNLAELLQSHALDLAVEELLRHDSYVQATNRVCIEAVELGGQHIEKGDNLILLLGAANRDPERFAAPDDLVLNRMPNPHMGLGWGSHVCLGSFLAREMMKIALSSMRDQVPQIRLAGEPIHKVLATVRCPDQIPVCFAP